ncbi:MAG TPA: hypothetical protein VF702_14860 [Allosphingosinicella sp.]|jgi:hypothetical protein
MAEKVFDIIATSKLMPDIVELAEKYGIEASAPMAVDSSSDALDAPLGVDELRQVLEVVTLIASTGTTVVGFLAAVKALMQRSEEDNGREPQARVVETMTRREIGSVTASSDIEQLDIR